MRLVCPSLVSLRVPLLAAALLVAFPGCKKATAPATALSLTVVQGNLQTAAAGTQLPTPIVLRVRGSDGLPLAKVPVSFSVTAGGGAVDPGTVISDGNGEVKAKWTLGPLQIIQQLTAFAPGLDAIQVMATGVMPADLIVAQGNNQVAKPSAALPVQLVIRVTGNGNIPIPNVTVAFAIVSGSGSITPQSSVTNALGEVTARWTMGAQAGAQVASVSAASLGPVLINAVAQ